MIAKAGIYQMQMSLSTQPEVFLDHNLIYSD